MFQPRKKPKKRQNICTWIRQRTSQYCFGVRTKGGNPAHCNGNDDIKYHFQTLKMGWRGRRLSRLRNADMTDHFSAQKTFYFTADGRSVTSEVLVNIDIDCHGSGSLAGAIAFAEHLRATRFPNMYFETSTNGNGVHGFIVVVKGDLGDEGLNSVLSILDRWLKAELAKGDWDVENAEIKGQAPVFTWGRQKYELKSYKSGQLAKLPREALTRADELLETTRISVSELRRLPVPVANESEASVFLRAGKATKKTPVVSVSESENWENPSVASAKPERKTSGSIVGRHFDDEELAKLSGGYLSLAKELLGEKQLVASWRKIVTEEDLAIFLMLLRFFNLNMNPDGSLPVARWKEMWSALYQAGDIERGWCHHRFARIRNFLTSEGWLSWQDESFVVGVNGEDGHYVPGRASKWKAGEELIARMKAVEVDLAERFDVASEAGGGDEVIEGEEGVSTLYGNNQTYLHIDQLVNDQDDLAEAPRTAMLTKTTIDLRQSASFQDVLDHLGIWTPIPKPRFAGYNTDNYRKAA